MATNQNQFDFKAFNGMVKEAGAGLKLHLALGLLKDVDYTMYRYSNPLGMEVREIISDLIALQVRAKAAAAARAKA